jgi:ferredoxin-thioredoxin reductase catalytic subunit
MIKIYDTIVYVALDKITPYENNARVNDKSVEALVKILPRTGFNVPLVLDMQSVIVKGHSRYEALKKLGYSEAPCIMIDGTEDEIREERLIDNKMSDLSEYDDEKLLYELKEMSFDFSGIGLELPEIKETKMGIRDINQRDMDRAEERMGNVASSQELAKLKEIICPCCGESFYVDIKELLRYGQ